MVKTSEMSMELKQELAFTKEELAELEAAKKLFIENGGTAENFIPTADTVEEEFKNIMSVKFRRVNPPRNRMGMFWKKSLSM